MPEDVEVRYEFDESPTVRAAIKSVATEGAIGAVLTGLMILLFLRDVRSVIVVLVSIPLSLTGSLVGLWLTGNTINIMSLGGLALAIGILVDEATVTIENTHAQMHHTDSIARAARRANAATATARLLAMLCILSVFIPTFILNEPVRSLFMPLTLAVGFCHDRLLPALEHARARALRLADAASREQAAQEGLLRRVLPRFAKHRGGDGAASLARGAGLPGRRAACCFGWSAGRSAPNCFPQVDSGQFVLRFRAPPGSEYELTRKCAVKILDVIDRRRRATWRSRWATSGLAATNTATNNMLLFMRASDDGRAPRAAAGTTAASRLPTSASGCARRCPEEVVPWLKKLLEQEGCSPEEAQARARQVSFGFEPGDIVSR